MGLKEFWESREVLRFALCFSFQPQLVPGFIISKGNKAPDGRKLAGAQAAGPSALGASQQIVPWKQGGCPCRRGVGAGWGLTPPNTGPWRRPCVSRTAALAGGTVLGSDLGNSVVSRVPATLATCPCHSLETPSGPCSPVSVPVPAPPPWEGWLHACIPSGSEDPYWAASGPLGPWNPPSHLHSAPPIPTPVPGTSSGLAPPRGPAGASSLRFCP